MLAGTLGRVQSPRVIRIGGGVASEVADVLAQLGLAHPLIVTDPGVVALGHFSVVTDVLAAAGMQYGVFDGVVEDPTDACVEAGLAAFAAGSYDCVIGFGGGSPMDTSKAVSFMAVNPGHVRDYKAPTQIDRCGVPIVLIPTTGGTGSELTRWCVITDTKSPEKYNLSGLACVATAALIDWIFSVTKPPRITADTAVDSLTHAIEAYVSRKAFPYIGAHFHVAHGLSNAMLLPAVTAFSVEAAPARYATSARVMGMAGDTDSDAVACGKLIEGLRQLNADLAVPSPSALGHKADDAMLQLMATQALASGSPANNPRVPDADEIVSLYKEMW